MSSRNHIILRWLLVVALMLQPYAAMSAGMISATDSQSCHKKSLVTPDAKQSDHLSFSENSSIHQAESKNTYCQHCDKACECIYMAHCGNNVNQEIAFIAVHYNYRQYVELDQYIIAPQVHYLSHLLTPELRPPIL